MSRSPRSLGAAVVVVLLSVIIGCGGSREPTGPEVGITSSTVNRSAAESATASTAPPSPVSTTPTAAEPATPVPPGPTVPPAGPPTPAIPPAAAASPAPAWLGTRVLGPAGDGPVSAQVTPPELSDRRLITVDVLPPPADQAFAAEVVVVPPEVLARSTWQSACPVAAADLRYVTVPFWGFDERLHTGELLLHADAVDAVVAAFAAMHAERFPLEEVRVIRSDELDLAPTGDGNVTSAFVCRPVTGGTRWSDHAYGRAIDVNPFHNPYDRGAGPDRVVLPELATAYTDRGRDLPGMITVDSAVAMAFASAGWGWGGDYRSLKDYQHFSASGG